MNCDDNISLLTDVINSLEKLLSFFKYNYRDLNLDGLFGLRVLEGHLQSLIIEYKNGSYQHLSQSVVKRLQYMAKESTVVSNQALDFVKKDDETYFNTMGYVIGMPWNILHKHRQLDPDLRWKSKTYKDTKDFKIDEATSDKCMAEITGAKTKNHKHCIISKGCLEIMTMKGLTEYGVTHQILWTMLAEKANCLQEMNTLLISAKDTTVTSMQTEFCTNNFFEMVAVVHLYLKGKITTSYQDLFLEQQFVCPSLGFYEFLKKEYLEQILSWQLESGCFSNEFNNVENVKDPSGQAQKQNKDFVAQMRQNVNEIQQKQGFETNSFQKASTTSNHSLNKTHLNILQTLASNQPTFMKRNQQGASNNFQPLIRGVVNNNNNAFKQHEFVGQRPKLQNVDHKIIKSVLGSNDQQQDSHNNYFGRKLLAEKEMKDGCMAHTTAVATGALVMYLRYLIDPGPMDLYGSHHILQDTSRTLLGEIVGGVKKSGQDSVGILPDEKDELNQNMDNNVGEDNLENEEDEDDYNDEEEEDNGEEEDADYDNEENDEDFYPDVETNDKNKLPVVHFGVKPNEGGGGEDMDTPKNNPDDGDYTYYDEDHEVKNNLQNNDIEVKPLNKFVNKLDDSDINMNNENNNIDNPDIKLEDTKKDTFDNNNNKNNIQAVYNKKALVDPISPPSRSLIMFVIVCCLVLLVLMFRFIKKRRIHIRYHPRGFFRL